MRELVEEMLDTASLEARAKTAAVMRVDLSNVTTEYALQYEALFYENGVTFNSEIQGKVFVLGDPQLTERLVRTLLDNAYKYTPKGGRAEVRLHATKKQAELLVTNTGIGIQKDDLELIFERFYRSDATRTHLEGGYGLGLSIAKSTAESELIKQYEFMHRIFRNAHARLAEAQTDDERRRLLKILGDAALEEHAEWILMHRERAIDQKEAVRLG